MDIGRIFSRSLELLWRFKFLWLFGLIMGLTAGGGGGGGSSTNFQSNSMNNPFTGQQIEPTVVVIAVIAGLILFVAGLVLFFYLRFVARGAMVTTVRDAEAQATPTLRTAWQNGRKFYTRLLGLGFLVNLPLALLSICAILAAAVPLVGMIMAQTGNRFDAQNSAPGWIAAAFVFCGAFLCIFVLTFIIHPLYEFAVRAIVLEDLSVRQGLRRGVQNARENLGSVIVVYLLLLGARIGYGLVTAFVLIPVGVFLGIGGIALAQTNLNALILLALVFAIPLWLLFGAIEGIFQAFESNVWTEAYLALENKSVAVTA